MACRKVSPAPVNPVLVHPDERRMSLDGQWQFALDPEDRGLAEKWFADPTPFTERIMVPGTWQGQGFGGEEKERIRDFGLEARTLRATYTGTAWYRTILEAPSDWHGQRIWLNFGGAHPSADVWLNGQAVGGNDLPYLPFGFDVTDVIRPDEPNDLVVRVHERHRWLGFAYNWQGNWSGLYRSVELTATGSSFLDRLWITPSVDDQLLRLRVRVGGLDASRGPLTLGIAVQRAGNEAEELRATFDVAQEDLALEIPVPNPALWSPDAPNLYRVDAVLAQDGAVVDARSDRAGFVKLTAEQRNTAESPDRPLHVLINDEPYYLRGTGDFVSCPETAAPDTDRDRWRRKLRALRDYGYNMVRCQSYVYSPEYLDAADEAGLLIQSEMGMLGAWSGHDRYHVYPWPQPTPDCREIVKRQWNGVVMRDLNHPSANAYCMSNELAECFHPRIAWQCYRETKALKPTALVIWTDGRYNEDLPGDFFNTDITKDIDKSATKPVIQHEFRWWSSFPDVRIAPKYSGAIRPYAAEMAQDAARRQGIDHILAQAAANSQRLQLIEAKGKMEACRRDWPALAGISHFNAMDANPSPQGIIDEFYERKCTDADTWIQTNGDTVVLCSLGFDNRVLAAGDTFRCALYVSDYAHPPFENPILKWSLATENGGVASGRIVYRHEPFKTCSAGEIECDIPEVTRPTTARLSVRLHDRRQAVTNMWDLWLFPRIPGNVPGVTLHGPAQYTWLKTVEGIAATCEGTLPAPQEAMVLTERIDPTITAFMQDGGRVLLAASEGLVRPFSGKLGLNTGRYFFTPPANYPPYESGHDGTIVKEHPMFGEFPHEGFADLQFYRMLAESPPLDLAPLGLTEGDPVIRAIHSYPVCRPLGYLVEGMVGEGRLILCALDLDQSWPEARYLLRQLCRYLANGPHQKVPAISQVCLEQVVAATAIP